MLGRNYGKRLCHCSVDLEFIDYKGLSQVLGMKSRYRTQLMYVTFCFLLLLPLVCKFLVWKVSSFFCYGDKIPALFSLQLLRNGETSLKLKQMRRLLNTEKLIFKTESLEKVNDKVFFAVLC